MSNQSLCKVIVISVHWENLYYFLIIGTLSLSLFPPSKVTSHKSKHNAVLSESSHETQLEIMWSKDREMPPFPACSSLEDHEQVDVSSGCISGDNLDKTEPTKDTSNISVKSDQTTLEYQDAKSPGDLEDNIFVASQPANSFSKDTIDVPESAEKESNEIIESGPLQMEEPTSVEQVTGKCNGIYLATYIEGS